MSRSTPRDLDPARLRRLWRSVDRARAVGERMADAGRSLLGLPYVTSPLIGSVDTPEVFTASLAGFDCVTYVETAMAAAMAPSPEGFAGVLRRIRYEGGRVSWRERNHYTTDWLRRNAKAGFLRPVGIGAPPVVRARVLSVLPGYPVRRRNVRSVPKRRFWAARGKLQTGDVVVFASTKRNRDTFHLGLVLREKDEVYLLNAARSKGGVVKQKLADFLADNSMAGVIVARPIEP
jgi:cell wall-associated NlpC family hydrolase